MLLTIYTPTYNRAHLLPKLYESLCNQTSKKFKWLVVDDGSTDNTKEIVLQWAKESLFNISYVYKKNGGVHTARDLAYSIIDTDLLVGIDSDDQCMPNMVDDILNVWNLNKKQNIIGIITPVCSPNGSWLGAPFPEIEYASFQDLTFKYKCVGDHTIVIKSDVIKKVSNAPVFDGEKLIGEVYKWIQLPDVPFYLLKKATVIHHYMEDGYSKNVRKLWFDNLKGFAETYNICSSSAKFFYVRMKNSIKFNIASFFCGDFFCIKKSKNKIGSILTYSIAFFFFLYLKFKWKKYYLNS